ncbi:hypothetical protein GCM10010399_49370 [Dactylosporangium fulvum]
MPLARADAEAGDLGERHDAEPGEHRRDQPLINSGDGVTIERTARDTRRHERRDRRPEGGGYCDGGVEARRKRSHHSAASTHNNDAMHLPICIA